MSAEHHAIVCAPATAGALPFTPACTVRLRRHGPHANVRVGLDGISGAAWRDPPDVFLDLLDLAAYVYAADQAVSRGTDRDEHFGARWRRSLHFAVPVRRPDVWGRPDVRESLTSTLGFLSEDRYQFHFAPFPEPPSANRTLPFRWEGLVGAAEEVMLFSGGLDSLAGAAELAVLQGRPVALVHHRSNPKATPVHWLLLRELRRRAPRPPLYFSFRVDKERGLSRDNHQRARSFLYASLGATVATLLGLGRLLVFENGVVSLNLPPSAQVVGARASRTTHPRVLRGFEELFTLLAGRPFRVENPFLWDTKTDVLGRLARAGCADLVGHTWSCAFPRHASTARPHCGVCSQCIDRRFAVLAAGLAAHDPAEHYRLDLLTGDRPEGHPQTMLAVYVEMARQIRRMSPAQFFARFGEVARALTALPGPAEVAAQQVFSLYRRHADQVYGAVRAGLEQHSAALLDRTLPPRCLLQMVRDDREDVPAAPAAAEAPLGPHVFRQDGQAWRVRFAGGRPFTLVPSRGAAYLHALLSRAGSPVPAVELAFEEARGRRRLRAGDAGAELDRDDLAAYRARLADLQEDLAEARRNNDPVAAERLREAIALLAEEVRKARGPGGRARKAADDRERVRKAVGNAVRRAVGAIREYDPALADHLRPPWLRCGLRPCYLAPPGVTWET